MAFIKIGDSQPVLNYHDGDEEVLCKKCHKPKVVVALKQDEQELICECELDENKSN